VSNQYSDSPQSDKTSAAQAKKVGQFHKKLGLDATFNNISVIYNLT
jgi:hypothetical protein